MASWQLTLDKLNQIKLKSIIMASIDAYSYDFFLQDHHLEVLQMKNHFIRNFKPSFLLVYYFLSFIY